MKTIGSFDAKNRFSELIELAERGEEIAITKYGRIVARIVPPANESKFEAATRAIERIRARRKKLKVKATLEEIKKWRDEGRP